MVRGIENQDGQWIQDISFECEATVNEIKGHGVEHIAKSNG